MNPEMIYLIGAEVSDLRARLADTLSRHQSWDALVCDCGWNGDDGLRAWSSHVADVLLSLPGIAIVDSQELLKRLDGLAAKYDESRLPDHARGIRRAGNLIAALLVANAAEGSQSD